MKDTFRTRVSLLKPPSSWRKHWTRRTSMARLWVQKAEKQPWPKNLSPDPTDGFTRLPDFCYRGVPQKSRDLCRCLGAFWCPFLKVAIYFEMIPFGTERIQGHLRGGSGKGGLVCDLVAVRFWKKRPVAGPQWLYVLIPCQESSNMNYLNFAQISDYSEFGDRLKARENRWSPWSLSVV